EFLPLLFASALALATIAAVLNSRVHTIATMFVCLFVLAALPAMHGVDHPHFEIRDAPTDDPYNRWQRDAIHPLTVLPHADAGPPAILPSGQ
ncbi:MAG TPA: hypothetical protein QF813_06250, partial [Alphaproteobacteria bacterium]|nr:hypothetical protein [Alphaproteobacteria bacterium]